MHKPWTLAVEILIQVFLYSSLRFDVSFRVKQKEYDNIIKL